VLTGKHVSTQHHNQRPVNARFTQYDMYTLYTQCFRNISCDYKMQHVKACMQTKRNTKTATLYKDTCRQKQQNTTETKS